MADTVVEPQNRATLSIYCSEAFKQEIRVEAAHQGKGMSSSEWVRHALRAAVDASKLRRLG